jgi:hypothetical protein
MNSRACRLIDRAALLELVELFEHGDRDRDVVLLEAVDGVGVVEDDRGVEDEDLVAGGETVLSGCQPHGAVLESADRSPTTSIR